MSAAQRTRKPGQSLGELALIAGIRRRAGRTNSALRLGIGDDCALIRLLPGEELAVTTDLSVAGRHFRLDWHQPEAVGHRALARGLSDLAAMGARPVAAFLSLGLPQALAQPGRSGKSWADRFFDGLFALASRHKTPLAGGDLSQSPVAMADIVLLGALPRGKALLRSGARPGDRLYVTGALGGAAASLEQLARLASIRSRSTPPRLTAKQEEALAAHLAPEPRLAQGAWLRQRGLATSAIDLSDGLSTDLTHLCEESHVAAEIDAELVPLARGATLAQALHGGEDYELLFTAPATAKLPRTIAGVPLSCIGRILHTRKGRATVTLRTGGKSAPLSPAGWQHFV
jgi:thiamine-monophosphate kinase